MFDRKMKPDLMDECFFSGPKVTWRPLQGRRVPLEQALVLPKSVRHSQLSCRRLFLGLGRARTGSYLCFVIRLLSGFSVMGFQTILLF